MSDIKRFRGTRASVSIKNGKVDWVFIHGTAEEDFDALPGEETVSTTGFDSPPWKDVDGVKVTFFCAYKKEAK